MKNDELVFATERMLVRPLRESDFAALHLLCGDARVMQYVGNLQPYTPDQTRAVISQAQYYYQEHGFGPWAIVEKESGRFIGYGGIEFLPLRAVPELFYVLGPDFWGQGLATEFAAAVVDIAFTQYNLPAIGASFDPANEPSMRVARKVGLRFQREGVDEFDLPTIYYIMENPQTPP